MDKLIPLDIPPGVINRGTTYQNSKSYVDSNLIRFINEAIDPVGGWEEFAFGNIDGICRSFFVWTSNAGTRWMAIGTTRALYVTDGVSITNISPVDLVLPGDNPARDYGYGTALYGTENYNEPVGDGGSAGPSFAIIEYGYWHFDSWGENLVATLGSDGRLLEWTPNTPLALVVSGAPVGIRGLAVSDERHLVVICETEDAGATFHPRRVLWCSQENNTDWTASPTNTAGDLELQTDSIGVRIFRFGGSVYILTLGELHRLRYIGTPYIHALETVSPGCGITNPGAIAFSSTMAFWLSPRGFFAFDGNQVSPVMSDVEDLVDGNVLKLVAQQATATMGHNELFNSFICFLPEGADPRPVRYVEWDYMQKIWTVGHLDRSAWGDPFTGEYPVAAQPYFDGSTWQSRIYQHEKGYGRPNLEGDRPYVVTGPIEIAEGDRFVTVRRLMQDVEGDASLLKVGMEFKAAPQGAVLKTIAPVSLNTARGYSDYRGTGRMVSLTIEEDADKPSGYWRWGRARLALTPGESR